MGRDASPACTWTSSQPGPESKIQNGHMILLINGPFGVGKTTVGRLIRRRIPGSRLYNPEWTGSLLMRLPFIRLRGAGTDDFQDIDLWRRTVVHGTRVFRSIARDTVIVPMTFSRRDYYDEIVSGIREFDDDVRTFCLKAEMPTILERLKQRGEKIREEEDNWPARKLRECIEAHKDPHFGEPLNTENLTAAEVADQILQRL